MSEIHRPHQSGRHGRVHRRVGHSQRPSRLLGVARAKPDTRKRAEEHQLIDVGSLEALCKQCPIVLSVVPPSAAEDVAEQVIAQKFKGTFADLNAISPQRAQRIGERLETNGIKFVDGGIIGPPAWQANTTWLSLSGKHSSTIASCFTNGPLQTEILGDRVGDASALEDVLRRLHQGAHRADRGRARHGGEFGRARSLMRRWAADGSGLDKTAAARVTRITDRAWRWVGEMDEIASTFEHASMPRGFHDAAGDIYRRLAQFKDQAPPSSDTLLEALKKPARPA